MRTINESNPKLDQTYTHLKELQDAFNAYSDARKTYREAVKAVKADGDHEEWRDKLHQSGDALRALTMAAEELKAAHKNYKRAFSEVLQAKVL